MRKYILAAAAAAIATMAAAAYAMVPAPAAVVAVENQSGTAFEAAESFLRHLRAGAYSDAYAMSAPALRAKVSAETFRKEVSLFQRIGMQSVSWESARTKFEFMNAEPNKPVRWNVYQSEFNGDLAVRGGKAIVRFHWINEDGTWRLMSFRWDNAPVQTSQVR